ncbi:MAG: ECF-type sigma factor [Phycisphaerales bacterium]
MDGPAEPIEKQVTLLLEQMSAGRANAAGELLPLVYEDLRRVAASLLSLEGRGHTLQPTALVHEAYMRLAGQRTGGWDGRVQFISIAAGVMRRVLVDHARAKKAVKRGGGAPAFTVADAVEAFDRADVDLVALDEALVALADLDERKARLIELRFFGGLEVEHAARLLDVPLRTAERDWAFARAWLRDRLKGV